MPVLFPLLYTCTLLPVAVCFVETPVEPWITLDWIVTAFFAVDMVVSFLSAYWDKDKHLIVDGGQIAKHYLRGWFWIDLVATFPFGGTQPCVIVRMTLVDVSPCPWWRACWMQNLMARRPTATSCYA